MTSKDHPEKSPEGLRAKADAQDKDTASREVQAQVDADEARGFRGTETDPTPNENYTVAGVTSGLPTPETDKAHAEKVRQYQSTVETQVNGVSKR